MPTAITIEGLSKHYPAPRSVRGPASPTIAVDTVSLTIPPGSLFFLLGPSGCGKTTLLRMIAGFITPTSGRILFNDRDITRTPPEKRNTGMVFQSYALWPHMTIEANIAFGLSIRKLARADRAGRVAEALAAVRMTEYAKRKPNQLSGGQQQRIALARALVIRPDVLLLDEPLSNLDARLRLEMRAEIRRICKGSGITTIYVTHDQKEALSMADGLAVLDMGSVAQVGTPREVYERPASRFVADFMGETNFLPATIEHSDSTSTTLRTAAGTLTSSVPHAGSAKGSAVTCSIRPESLTIHHSTRAANPAAAAAPNTFAATITDSVYLGDAAQHIASIDSSTSLRITELKPAAPLGPGRRVEVSINPADIVILSA